MSDMDSTGAAAPSNTFQVVGRFDKAGDMAMMLAMRQISFAMTKVKGSRREAG